MSLLKREPVDPIDQALKHRLRNWAANQPIPKNRRAHLLKAAHLSTLPVEKTVNYYHFLHPEIKFNWTATYLAGDKLLYLRLVS
jgi:hypothetical protein